MDQHPPRLPDSRRHRGHLSPVGLDESVKPLDRLRKLPSLPGDVRVLGFGSRGGRKRSRGAWLLSFAGVAPAESRNVAPARYFNHQRVVAPGAGIVAGQGMAQPNRLDPHDRIDLRVEISTAAECFNRNGVGFEFLAIARQCHLDDERQKTGQTIGIAERTAVDDPMQSLADVVRMRPLRIELRDIVIVDHDLSIGCCMSISRGVNINPGTLILHRPPRWLNQQGDSIDSRAGDLAIVGSAFKLVRARIRSQSDRPVGKSELVWYRRGLWNSPGFRPTKRISLGRFPFSRSKQVKTQPDVRAVSAAIRRGNYSTPLKSAVH